MTTVPVITHYLDEAPLELAVCAACRALTRQEDFPGHQDWHKKLNTQLAPGEKPV